MRNCFAPCFLLVLLTWAVFWQVQRFDFVSFDDDVYVTENPHLSGGLSLTNLRWAFSTLDAAFYHPLTWLSLLLDVEMFGSDASGFHLTNLFWHTGSVLLLFALLKRVTGACWKSAFVAGLFAIHPLHVESVAWVAERKDVLSTFFGLLALWGYARYAQSSRAGWYVLVVVAYVCSLLSKSMLITLPFLLLLLDYWPLRRLASFRQDETSSDVTGTRRIQREGSLNVVHRDETDRLLLCQLRSWKFLLLEKMPLLLLSIFFCGLTIVSQSKFAAESPFQKYSLTARAANAINVYVIYIRKMFWPNDLTMYYPHPGEEISWGAVTFSAMLLAGISVVVVTQIRKRPYLFVGWFWYLGTLLPVIGFVQIWTLKMADRFTYIPLIGLFIGIVWSVASIVNSIPYRKRILSAVGVILMVAFSVIAHVQTGVWRNSISLFKHALLVRELEPLGVHDSLGFAYWKAGHHREAVHHFMKVVRQFPDKIEAHLPLGTVLKEMGETDLAIHHFRQAVKINERAATVHYNLGTTLVEIGELDSAVEHLRKAVKLDPDYALTHTNLGLALQQMKRLEEATGHFREAVRIEPDNAEFHINLGDVLFDQSLSEEAIASYRRALSIDPQNARAYNNLGVVFQTDRRIREAIEQFRAAIKADPGFVDARRNLRQLIEK